MLINFFRRRAGLNTLRKLHALLQLVLESLKSLLDMEDCPFDGLSHNIPALWSSSVGIASGYDLELEMSTGLRKRQGTGNPPKANTPRRQRR